MKKKYRHFNVQFHMLPDELLTFVEEVAATHAINLQLERWFPDRTFSVAAGESLKHAVGRFGYPDRIWLLMHDSELKPGGEYMMLNMGNVKDRVLTETDLSGRTKDDDAYRTWRAVFDELRRRAASGGWVVNPDLKTMGFYKSLHLSPAAAAASRRGELVLKDMSGSQSPNYIVPDEPNVL